jgi:hypothetical protein
MSLVQARSVLNAIFEPGFHFEDRRQHARHPYSVNQSFAPVVNGKMPSLDTFRSMRCRDISLGGISFYWPREPEFNDIVIELGTTADKRYVRAKVRGFIIADPQLPEYIIRCQFSHCIDELY